MGSAAMTTSRHHYHHDHHYYHRRRRPFLAQCCQAAHRRAGPARGSSAAGPNPCSSGIERSHVCMPPQTWRPGARSKGLPTYPAAAAAGQPMAEDSRRRRRTSWISFSRGKLLFIHNTPTRTTFHSSKKEILMKLGGLNICEQKSKIKTLPPFRADVVWRLRSGAGRARSAAGRFVFDQLSLNGHGWLFRGFSVSRGC